MRKLYLIPLFFVVALLSGYALSVMFFETRILNIGTVKTIDVNVFWDENCTNVVTQIEWGVVKPNTSKTFTVYVQSASNVPLTLSVYAENWNPPNCTQYMTFTASPNNVLLQPNEVVQVDLTLSVAFDIEGITTFTFDTVFSRVE